MSRDIYCRLHVVRVFFSINQFKTHRLSKSGPKLTVKNVQRSKSEVARLEAERCGQAGPFGEVDGLGANTHTQIHT